MPAMQGLICTGFAKSLLQSLLFVCFLLIDPIATHAKPATGLQQVGVGAIQPVQ